MIAMLPQSIAIARDNLNWLSGTRVFSVPGMETAMFGLILVVFMLFEPRGIYGRLCEDQDLFRALPASIARTMFQTAEKLPQDGADAMSLLEFDNVTLRFGGRGGRSTRCPSTSREGEVFALVGPQRGRAKVFTVFNLISRIYDPAEGGHPFRRQVHLSA